MMDFAAVAPLGLGFFIVPLLIGFAFGFVLESSGFGDCRRLAAQFYFTEARVVKVMFTAILVCMLLLLWTSAMGLIDLERIWVPPTWMGPGLLGGLLLGFGFIIGGYCPGTSLVSASTLKIDGMIFVGGVAIGAFLFGETAPAYRVFHDTAGYMGRVTLPEWMGISHGTVAILVVLLAAAMFLFFEWMERAVGGRAGPARRPWLVGGATVAAVCLVAALPLRAVGQPTVADRVERMRPALDRELESREHHVDPVELLGVMHRFVQGKPGRLHLMLADVRSEADYNRFHLVDAVRYDVDSLAGPAGDALVDVGADNSIKILMSNDEAAAEEAFRILRARGATNLYVLAGGVNLWHELFANGSWRAEPASNGDDSMRFRVDRAIGARHPSARPSFPAYERVIARKLRAFTYRIEPVVEAPAASGGCG